MSGACAPFEPDDRTVQIDMHCTCSEKKTKDSLIKISFKSSRLFLIIILAKYKEIIIRICLNYKLFLKESEIKSAILRYSR